MPAQFRTSGRNTLRSDLFRELVSRSLVAGPASRVAGRGQPSAVSGQPIFLLGEKNLSKTRLRWFSAVVATSREDHR